MQEKAGVVQMTHNHCFFYTTNRESLMRICRRVRLTSTRLLVGLAVSIGGCGAGESAPAPISSRGTLGSQGGHSANVCLRLLSAA